MVDLNYFGRVGMCLLNKKMSVQIWPDAVWRIAYHIAATRAPNLSIEKKLFERSRQRK